MTWQDRAAEHIQAITKDWPADMPVGHRRRALSRAGRQFAQGTSWPAKAWAKAQRAYLERHGQPKGWRKRKKPAGDTLDMFGEMR